MRRGGFKTKKRKSWGFFHKACKGKKNQYKEVFEISIFFLRMKGNLKLFSLKAFLISPPNIFSPIKMFL